MRYLKLWIALAAVILGSFAILGYYGVQLYRKAPPIPEQVVTKEGRVLFTGQDIRDGQNVWQSMGGQEVGSIWGHGAYVAPDWTADWLHRECLILLDGWAQASQGKPYKDIDSGQQAILQERLRTELRTNTYDPKSGAIVISEDRATAYA
ncbi:MAG: nitric-oxide reductase large subunit, partial [Verrucomicrobiaceae bacterium]